MADQQYPFDEWAHLLISEFARDRQLMINYERRAASPEPPAFVLPFNKDIDLDFARDSAILCRRMEEGEPFRASEWRDLIRDLEHELATHPNARPVFVHLWDDDSPSFYDEPEFDLATADAVSGLAFSSFVRRALLLLSSEAMPTSGIPSAAASVDAASNAGEIVDGATALGRNLEKLRLECGWSYDEMALQTHFDKKLIIGHISHGRGAHPKTLKIYADTFSVVLHRAVTVQELKSPPPAGG
jgi:hypothetical protein